MHKILLSFENLDEVFLNFGSLWEQLPQISLGPYMSWMAQQMVHLLSKHIWDTVVALMEIFKTSEQVIVFIIYLRVDIDADPSVPLVWWPTAVVVMLLVV